jgi:hypothetical protein
LKTASVIHLTEINPIARVVPRNLGFFCAGGKSIQEYSGIERNAFIVGGYFLVDTIDFAMLWITVWCCFGEERVRFADRGPGTRQHNKKVFIGISRDSFI